MENSEEMERLARITGRLFLIGIEILFWFACLLATAGIVLTTILYSTGRIALESDVSTLYLFAILLMIAAILLRRKVRELSRRKVKEKLIGSEGR